MSKELEDLTNIELMEDMGYWIQYAQYQSPTFTDAAYSAIWKAYMVLLERIKKDE